MADENTPDDKRLDEVAKLLGQLLKQRGHVLADDTRSLDDPEAIIKATQRIKDRLDAFNGPVTDAMKKRGLTSEQVASDQRTPGMRDTLKTACEDLHCSDLAKPAATPATTPESSPQQQR